MFPKPEVTGSSPVEGTTPYLFETRRGPFASPLFLSSDAAGATTGATGRSLASVVSAAFWSADGLENRTSLNNCLMVDDWGFEPLPPG